MLLHIGTVVPSARGLAGVAGTAGTRAEPVSITKEGSAETLLLEMFKLVPSLTGGLKPLRCIFTGKRVALCPRVLVEKGMTHLCQVSTPLL